MVSSCACYESALEHVNNLIGDKKDEEARHELLRRLGNVSNELGVKYMFWAQEEYTKHTHDGKDTLEENITADNANNTKASENYKVEQSQSTAEEPLYLKLAKKSYHCLIRGIKAFRFVDDKVNLAFLCCNMGRFMRFRAHLIIPNEE